MKGQDINRPVEVCTIRLLARYLSTIFRPNVPPEMRTIILIVLIGLFTATISAQDTALLSRVGWDPLPDSLMMTWGLPQDQVRRLRVIEEDYRAELRKAMAEAPRSEADRDARLRSLAQARKSEIRGVLTMRQYDAWQDFVRRHSR